jgi:A/G-specific adenine glycosylase
VYRVLSRYYGVHTPIDSTEGKKQFKALAAEVMDKSNPGEYNQAVMEFGALHCTPQNPECNNCPLNNTCTAYAENTITDLPVKAKKAKQKQVFYNYLVLINGTKTYLQKRDDKSIWKNMYEFPLIIMEKETAFNKLTLDDTVKKLLNTKGVIVDKIPVKAKHVLSHRIIHATFWKIYLEAHHFTNNSNIFEVSIGKLKTDYALPRLIDRYCNEHLEGY